jgi:pyrroloquinoline-quinone synthase
MNTTAQFPAAVAARCDTAVAARSLLQHPFYLAWSDGTLPVPALRDYARDYGAFIRTVSQGWETVGELHIASVERGHAEVCALGALYAFESQQPFTAQSKLAGLRAHYAELPLCCGEYFRLHEDDFEEPALLAEKMTALPAADQTRAVAACERLSVALHDALTGLYAPYLS